MKRNTRSKEHDESSRPSIPVRERSKKRDLSPKSARYQKQFLRGGGAETFIMIPLSLYRIMSRDEVQVLVFLWNLRNVLEMAGELAPKGWFYCTAKRLESALGMNRQVQHRILKKLQDRGFIKTERRGGARGRRFVIVRRKKVLRAVDRYWQHEGGWDTVDTYDEDKRRRRMAKGGYVC